MDLPARVGTPRDGRGNTFAALYRDYAQELSDGLRGRYGSGPPDPDDVTQEAFRRVFERGDLSSIDNLRAFLWRTARNLMLSLKARDATPQKYAFEVEQIFFPLRGDNSSPETVLIAKEQLQALNAHLRAMPEKRRLALLLYRIEGMTLSEVGKELEIGRTAVSKHLAKAEAEINALFLAGTDDQFIPGQN